LYLFLEFVFLNVLRIRPFISAAVEKPIHALLPFFIHKLTINNKIADQDFLPIPTIAEDEMQK